MMEKQKNNIPQLRFPEFDGEWENKKMGDLLEFKNGINANKEQYGSGYKFINVLDILNNDYIIHEKIIGSVNVDKEIISKYLVNYGDILFQRSSETCEEVGTACVYLDKEQSATFGGFVIRGRKIGEYEPVFLNRLLKTDLARDQITSKSGGSTRYNVGQETLSTIILPFPTLSEQTRIATFFTAIDQKLSHLKQKKTLLEQYKKGVMQRIFSQELRFKDEKGKEFPEWMQLKIGKLFEERSEKGFIGLELLSVSINTGVEKKSDTSKIDNSSKDKSNYKKVKKNDIVYNSMRMWQGASGVSKYEGIVSPAYTVICPKSNQNPDYFGYLFKTAKMINIFQNNSQGLTSDTWNLKFPQLSKIELNVPEYNEQTKIANFLSSLDEKINHCQKQIEQTEQWKKGLLQKMFC